MRGRGFWRLATAATVIAISSVAVDGAAQPATSAADEGVTAGRSPMALTVSGGVSLGTYEGGYLYYLTEFFKYNPLFFEPRVATGASAGSINAFISLLNLCSEQVDDPTESLFWRVWIPISIQNMLVEEDATPVSALSRATWESSIDELRRDWEQGLPLDCDAVLGVTVTRLNAMEVTSNDDLLTFNRTEEKFALRIRGRGAGVAPELMNYVDPDSGFLAPMLAIDGPDASPIDEVATLLIASAAFPIAFSPVSLPHCMTGTNGRTTCTPEDAESRLFLDGGVFDNTPLRFAAELVASGLERGSDESRWREQARHSVSDLPEEMSFLFVSPEVFAYPHIPSEEIEDVPSGLTDLIGRFFGNFIETARTKELADLFRANPELHDQVIVSRGFYPPVSGLLGAFLGFFEREFRVHDFYLGMADARRTIEIEVGARLGAAELAAVRWVEPEPVDGRLPDVWRPFACFRQVTEGAYEGLDVCSGDELRDFRAALQMTVDRLYDHCRRVAEASETEWAPRHPECMAAMAGELPPNVPGIDRSPDEWQLRTGEDELSHAMRLLAAYEFEFRDMELDRDEGYKATERIGQVIGLMMHYLAEEQTRGGMLLHSAARFAANSVYYIPVRNELHVLIGEAWEIGGSGLIPTGDWRGFRWSFALQLLGLQTLISSRNIEFGLAPLGGFEFESVHLSSALLQFRLGLRIGYLFSTADGFLTQACPAGGPSGMLPCSRFLTQTFVAVSFGELIRVHLSVLMAPPLREDESFEIEFHPQAGIQFNFGL